MRSALARWRWAGLGVIWDASDPEPEPLHAVAVQRTTFEALLADRSQAPQVHLTVVHVQAGALVNFGGIDPRFIPAVPQQRAVTAITGGLVTENNGGAQGVTDDAWEKQQQTGGKA